MTSPPPASAIPPSHLFDPHWPAWQALWRGFGVQAADAALLRALLEHYAQAHRKYHTQQHLDACLRHFEAVRSQAQHPEEVALALWFHDAIYEIGAIDNEVRSADWARSALLAAGVPAEAAARVHALVMATRHDVAPRTGDEQLLLDTDLSILGAPPAVFDTYELQIRAENAFVEEAFFRARRSRILQQFLDRERIYHTEHFHTLLESSARENLARSIRQLAA